jgi:NADPH-dependent 7-cyano-7-deazaguanine reductase QueF
MREHFINSRLLLEKVEKIELILDSFENSQIEQDHEIHKIFKILDELMSNPNSLERKRIGF